MAINVSQAFHRTSANPVDESMALTKAQMLTVNDNLMPAYYFTICQDDGKIYLYDKSATVSATTGKFKEFEGGGGGSSTGVIIDATLTAVGWNSSNQQTVTFTGYESSMGGVIGMPVAATATQKEAYAEAKINVISQSGTSFTFECEKIPSIDLPVTLYAGGGSGGGGGADLPSGGTTGQALIKHSNTDQDVEWATINSIPDGGTTGQVLAKHSATNKDVEWVDQIDTQKEILDNGTAVTDRDTINFTDFDISDDSTNEETDIKAHRLTSAEIADIMSTLPGAPVQQHTYSTNEQKVGTWIDGKPLYEKTINKASLSPSQGEIIDVSLKRANVNCKDWFATGVSSAGRVKFGDVWIQDGNNFKPVAWQHENGFALATSEAITDIEVTVRYTKTTD